MKKIMEKIEKLFIFVYYVALCIFLYINNYGSLKTLLVFTFVISLLIFPFIFFSAINDIYINDHK
jgi:hypothetical protein